jgi:hypothetical protein
VSGAYDDIINLPHPTSAKHPRMPLADRAAIFSPFAALAGHGAAIEETARLTDQRIELTEEEKTLLDEKLRLLLETGRVGAFTYFLPDGRKDGGAYVTTVGTIKKIDPLKGQVILTDRTAIPIEDILEIEAQAPPGQGL